MSIKLKCGPPLNIPCREMLKIKMLTAQPHVMFLIRRVFSYDGVGAVVRNTERYILVKIKRMESEESCRCRLRLHRLWSNKNYIISSNMHAFWLVLTYDLLEDRRIDDVIIKTFFNSLLYKTNRFQVAMRLFSNRSQRT